MLKSCLSGCGLPQSFNELLQKKNPCLSSPQPQDEVNQSSNTVCSVVLLIGYKTMMTSLPQKVKGCSYVAWSSHHFDSLSVSCKPTFLFKIQYIFYYVCLQVSLRKMNISKLKYLVLCEKSEQILNSCHHWKKPHG